MFEVQSLTGVLSNMWNEREENTGEQSSLPTNLLPLYPQIHKNEIPFSFIVFLGDEKGCYWANISSYSGGVAVWIVLYL